MASSRLGNLLSHRHGGYANKILQESQSGQYHLPGKDSDVVSEFLEIMHGKDWDYEPVMTSLYDCDEEFLRLAKIYCRADELQAEVILTFCIEVLQEMLTSIVLDEPISAIYDTLMYLEDNSGRKQRFLSELIQRHFCQEIWRLSLSKDPKHASENACYDYLMSDPDCRALMVKMAVVYPHAPPLVFEKFLDNKHFIELSRSEDFAAAITEAWLKKQPLDFSILNRNERFVSALRSSPFAYDCLQDNMSEEWRLGNSRIYQCMVCSTVIFTGRRTLAPVVRCHTCDGDRQLRIINDYEFRLEDGSRREVGLWVTDRLELLEQGDPVP